MSQHSLLHIFTVECCKAGLNEQNKDPGNRNRYRLRSKRLMFRSGTTLVELMIAAVILGLIFSSIFACVAQTTKILESARDRTRSGQIIQSQIEQLRSYNWTVISALPKEASFQIDNTLGQGFNHRYKGSMTISQRSTDQVEVTVTVTWTNNWGQAQKELCTTWITEGGLYDYYYRSF